MNKYELKVGQTLYIRDERSIRNNVPPLTEYEIEKIGRVYAKLKHSYYRVELETLRLDGGLGTVYLSPGHYARCIELAEAWKELWTKVRNTHQPPEAATIENIKEASRLLGFTK